MYSGDLHRKGTRGEQRVRTEGTGDQPETGLPEGPKDEKPAKTHPEQAPSQGQQEPGRSVERANASLLAHGPAGTRTRKTTTKKRTHPQPGAGKLGIPPKGEHTPRGANPTWRTHTPILSERGMAQHKGEHHHPPP